MDSHTLSLHVYSPALTSMTYFDLAGDRLVSRGTEWVADGCGEQEHDQVGETAAGAGGGGDARQTATR